MQSSAHGFCLCKRTHTLGGGGGNKRAGYRGAPCGGVPLVQAVLTIPVAVCVEARLVAVAIADPVRVAVSPASRRPSAQSWRSQKHAEVLHCGLQTPLPSSRHSQPRAQSSGSRSADGSAGSKSARERPYTTSAKDVASNPSTERYREHAAATSPPQKSLLLRPIEKTSTPTWRGAHYLVRGNGQGNRKAHPSCCARPPAAPLPVGSRPSP